jgi:hypothetical protein
MGYLLEIESEGSKLVSRSCAADLQRPRFTIEGVEEQLSIGIGGMTLALRLDRVDRLEDGSIVVIDYKTGGDAEPTRGSRRRDCRSCRCTPRRFGMDRGPP